MGLEDIFLKKVLIINGSPRIEGATSQVLGEIKKGLEQSGVHVLDYQLNQMAYKGCQGCMSCKQTGSCCLTDELRTMLNELKNADGIVIGSPIYMYAISGQTKLFMDRLYSLIDYQYRPFYKKERKLFTVYSMGSGTGKAFAYEQDRVSTSMRMVGFEEVMRMNVPGISVGDYPVRLRADMMKQAFEAGKKFAHSYGCNLDD